MGSGEKAIVTAAPESERQALQELERALSRALASKDQEKRRSPRRAHGCERTEGILPVTPLAPGVLRVETPRGWKELADAFQAQPPIFIRHVQPVQREVSLTGESADLERLAAAAAELAQRMDPSAAFSVQTRLVGAGEDEGEVKAVPLRRFEVNDRLAAAVGDVTGAPLDVRDPQQVLSVLTTPDICYLGVSRAEENLSPWAGGAMRFAREPDQVSRSEFKLLEALAVFGLRLPPEGRALDLGAAPGGWTRVLRRSGLEVTAVDPGDLDPRLAGDPGVRHVRATAQEFRCRRDEFDVIVNDMRMDARDSAQVMLAYEPCLKPGGFAVMTIKLPHQAPEQVAHQAIRLLLRRYAVRARQLYHNRSEITAVLEKR